ncbi:hypothetical protein [Porphyromonas sp.]
MHYTFRYSTQVKVLTALGLLTLGLLLYLLCAEENWISFARIVYVEGVVLLLYPPLSMPLSLTDDGEEVILRRLLWTTRYSRSVYDITEERSEVAEQALRVLGSGGYFGFSGLFYKSGLGFFRLLKTESTTHYLRIQRKGGSWPLYIACHSSKP